MTQLTRRCVRTQKVEDYIVYNDENIKPYRDNYGPAIVPDGSLFLLGDNRDFSYDSRMFGFIDLRTIKGKAKWIYWSWDKENLRVRWDRIGKTFNE
ncbi:MAG: signal peptidase I [Desulfobacterales bacterium]|nr:MAG: signal peptidase I [Desulfobacterales bacterium]